MFETSIRMCLRGLLLATVIAGVTPPAARSQTAARDSIRITPEDLTNGAPCVLSVSLVEEASTVTGKWQGHPVAFFFRGSRRTWYAVVGVDVEVAPGNYPLAVEADLKDGTHVSLHEDVAVGEAPYEKVPLSVPDKFVEPDAAAMRKIAADKVVKDRAFANSASRPQWTGDFLPPLHRAPESDSFGNQRLFNGKLASVHRGLDYHAKAGTPVAAINSGRVVLAQPLYYEGGCVVVDHGLGLMSVYMHLSKIEVAVGSRVRRGQVIALSGASGRATGPHLHLGVRWEGSYLDPAKLFLIKMPAAK